MSAIDCRRFSRQPILHRPEPMWKRFALRCDSVVSCPIGRRKIWNIGSGTGHLSDGRAYDNRYAWAFEVREQKIAMIREYLDSYYIVRLFGQSA